MKYRYVMNGMFIAKGRTYEIQVPFPHLREKKELAKLDGAVACYKFTNVVKPCIEIINKCSKGQIAIYDWTTFKRNGGYIKKLKEEKENNGFIYSDKDFLDTDETFEDLISKDFEDIYIDDEAYWIDEVY